LGGNDTITPIVVYVEQRYFGKSNTGEKVYALSDLVDLKLDNVVNDHVQLIKKLAIDLNTKNFLVFGGGHGGVIAGYVVNKFATDRTLTSYNVLGWSSSPPIKYLRHGSTQTGNGLQEINAKVAELLTQPGIGCTNKEITNLNNVFTAIKAMRTNQPADNVISTLSLDPIPQTNIIGTADPGKDLKELSIFIRNQIIGLTFDNNPYNSDGKASSDRKLKLLCDNLKPFTITSFTSTNNITLLNNILAVFSENTNKINWKLKTPAADGGINWNQDLAAAYYQDCTEYQIIFCSSPSNSAPDPFLGSQWDTSIDCNAADGHVKRSYGLVIEAECKGLFGDSFDPSLYLLSTTTYPTSLKNRVITTVNQQSIFGSSINQFGDGDQDEKSYAAYWGLWGVDNWEFQAPLSCDTDKAIDIRYLVLRAFGCLTGFVDNSNKICDTNLFNDDSDNANKPYDDTPPTTTMCSSEADPKKSKFPFGHKAVTIKNPEAILLRSTSLSPTVKNTSPVMPQSSTNGADSTFAMACILFSSVFLWTTAGALI